jgi:AraC-like DNA-binding protein
MSLLSQHRFGWSLDTQRPISFYRAQAHQTQRGLIIGGLTKAGEAERPAMDLLALTVTLDRTAACESVLDGKTHRWTARPGPVGFIMPKTPLKFRLNSDICGCTLYVPENVLRLARGPADEPLPANLRGAHDAFVDDPSLSHLISALIDDASRKFIGGRIFTESLMAMIVRRFLDRHVLQRESEPKHQSSAIVRQARAYIHDHLSDDLSLWSLAQELRCSVPTIVRHFRLHLGQSPHEYVMNERLQRATETLRAHPDWTLEEVAAQAGFADASHFARHFRARFGVSPRDQR